MCSRLDEIAPELNTSAGAEHHRTRRATKVEHSQFLASGDLLALEDRGFAGRNLGHPDGNEAHETDLCIVSFDKDKLTSGGIGEELQRLEVRREFVGTRLQAYQARGLCKVGAGDVDNLLDGPVSGDNRWC